MKYLDKFFEGYTGYWKFLVEEVTVSYTYKLWWENYFYWLILVSGIFLVLEWTAPWRSNQARFRKDFWLDFFYMFFNFFIFGLIIYNAGSNVVVELFKDFLGLFGITNLVAIQVGHLPTAVQLFLLFIIRDFIQWNVHRMLHRVPFLWEFHKVHHSVEEMGFAAHMRFHWMETVFYRSLEYIPLAMIGFGIQDFFVVHMFTFTWGHFNHSNLNIPLGPLKYVFNNPQMHIWHHAKEWPDEHKYGINFGLTLSVWDYLFGTAAIPHDGRDIALGFENLEDYPTDFISQATHGFGQSKE